MEEGWGVSHLVQGLDSLAASFALAEVVTAKVVQKLWKFGLWIRETVARIWVNARRASIRLFEPFRYVDCAIRGKVSKSDLYGRIWPWAKCVATYFVKR